MNASPLVSICVPTYNSALHLRESLDSIVGQTYENVEVIISDNSSTDETVSIANEYALKYGFKVVANKENIGSLNNWNRLIKFAKGEYVAIYHSDDIYEPAIVEESVNALRRNNNVLLVGTMANVIDCKGEILYSYTLPNEIATLGKDIYCFDEVLTGIFKSGNDKTFLITPSIMLKKSAYEELGMFDDKFKSSADYELWLRMAVNSDVAVVNKHLMNYRVHENQGSELELRKNLEIPDIVTTVRAYRNNIIGDSVRALCDRFIDERILRTALKQNKQGLFVKSNSTTDMTGTSHYIILKSALRFANRLHIKLKL